MKCWVTRNWISFFLHDGSCQQDWIQRHLDRCPVCRNYFRSQLDLSEALRSQATDLRQAAPAFLKARVMASLPSRQISAEASRPFLSHPVHLTAATALFCAMSAAILLWRHQPAPPVPADLRAMARTWIERSTNQMAALKTIEMPLEKEMSCVLSDAKSALLAVADGVLPAGVFDRPRGPGEE